MGDDTGSGFDAAGRLVSATAADGSDTTTSWTPDGFMAAVAYPDQTVSYGYDEVGNRTSMRDHLGTTRWVLDWAGRATSVTDAQGATVSYAFDLAGNETRVRYPDGRVLDRAFDGRGLAVSQSGPTGFTRFAFDPDGDLVSMMRPSTVKFLADPDYYWQEKSEQWQMLQQGWQAFRSDPGAAGSALWDAIKAPTVDCWNAGDYGCAVGHVTFAAAGLVAGGKGGPKLPFKAPTPAGTAAVQVPKVPIKAPTPAGAGPSTVAANTAGRVAPVAEQATAVIGRLPDTAVAKNWPGHEVLDIPDWTIAKNDQWVQSVDRKMPVYVGSNPTWGNVWDAAAGRTTVFGRELSQFTNAGYTWDGWTLLPPGGG